MKNEKNMKEMNDMKEKKRKKRRRIKADEVERRREIEDKYSENI